MILKKYNNSFKIDLSSFLLLLACFFSFSFNNLCLNKYHFILGSMTFYPIALGVIFSNFKMSSSDIKFLIMFLCYLSASVFVNFILFDKLITLKPFKSFFNLIFIFLIIELFSSKLQTKGLSIIKVHKAFLYSSYFLICTSFFDIYAISHGGIQSSIFENAFFKAAHPYDVPRLRGFTQEPSYYGMVLSTLYPFILIDSVRSDKLWKLIPLALFWTCILFSLSKVGIISCSLLTILIIKREDFLRLLLAVILFALIANFSGFDQVLYGNRGYLSQWQADPSQTVKVDFSTVIRLGHMTAAIRLWLDNFFIGIGLSQSGFYLDKYYPEWMLSSPEASKWKAFASVGGIPSFSFIPKVLAEIGFIGVLLILVKAYGFLKEIFISWKTSADLAPFCFSFLGFLISSFGVEGYLYLPAWIIFGVVLGYVRDKQNTSSVNLAI
jgi:hypothetical protein